MQALIYVVVDAVSDRFLMTDENDMVDDDGDVLFFLRFLFVVLLVFFKIKKLTVLGTSCPLMVFLHLVLLVFFAI